MQNRTHRGTVVSRNLTEEQLEVEFVQAFRDLLNAVHEEWSIEDGRRIREGKARAKARREAEARRNAAAVQTRKAADG